MKLAWLAGWISLVSIAVAAQPGGMSYLDNGQIRLGVDLSMGGAVTYLAESKHPVNMINSFDWGRQVQLSFYSGPVPFKPPGATLSKAWEGLGWNPIQAGDTYRHGSRVIEHRNDGQTIYVKCVPMIWPLDNVPAECTFECTYRLVSKTVEVTARLNNARVDETQHQGRAQELPAVYTNGPWYKLVTYTGDQPFTGAPTATLVDRDDGKGWPWLTFRATEHWAALLDQNDHGLGVFNAEAYRFGGGFHAGPKGSGGPKDGQTGYLAPNLDEILDHNIQYEFRYVLVVGTLKEIRDYACAHVPGPKLPLWKFANDRQHWIYHNTTDAGWPVTGELRVNLGGPAAALVSPLTFWRAADAGNLRIVAAFETPATEIQVQFEPKVGPVRVPIVGDGKYRTYVVDLSRVAGYKGVLTRLKLLLPDGKGVARVREIAVEK